MNSLRPLLVVVAGLPGSGKTPLARSLSRRTGWPLLLWNRVVRHHLRLIGHPVNEASIRAVTAAEELDPLLLAKTAEKLYASWSNRDGVFLVDGLKSPAVLSFLERTLERDALVIHAERPELVRRQAIDERADFDDSNDAERLAMLRRIGLDALLQRATLRVSTVGLDVVTQWTASANGLPAWERSIIVSRQLAGHLDDLLVRRHAQKVVQTEARRRASILLRSPNQKSILILRSSRTDKWTVPGGEIESGESARDAASRELYEETGVTVARDVLTPMCSANRAVRWDDVSLPEEQTTVFLAEAAHDEVTLSAEHSEYEWRDTRSMDQVLAEPFRSLCLRLQLE